MTNENLATNVQEPQFKVTAIQFWEQLTPIQISDDGDFEYLFSYIANILINDEFIIHCVGDDEMSNYSFPCSAEGFWGTEAKQNAMHGLHCTSNILNEIIEQIEADGFENNAAYLSEHGEKM